MNPERGAGPQQANKTKQRRGDRAESGAGPKGKRKKNRENDGWLAQREERTYSISRAAVTPGSSEKILRIPRANRSQEAHAQCAESVRFLHGQKRYSGIGRRGSSHPEKRRKDDGRVTVAMGPGPTSNGPVHAPQRGSHGVFCSLFCSGIL